MVPRFVSRNGFRPFIWNCGAALSRRASRASWSGRLLDDASDQYRRPASHWPLLLGAVENRPGDDGQEEAGGCLQEGQGEEEDGSKGVSRADHPSSILPQPPAILCNRFTLQRLPRLSRRRVFFSGHRSFSTKYTTLVDEGYFFQGSISFPWKHFFFFFCL